MTVSTLEPKQRFLFLFVTVIIFSCFSVDGAESESPMKVRVKDVARFSGVERQELIGFGLVVGLNGTGDSDEVLTQQTIGNVLQNFNLAVNPDDIVAENTAAVMVTATVRGSANKGDSIPAKVSTIGDASALTGGTLLLTPLKGPDGDVWARGQGSLTIGGYSFGGGAEGGEETVTKNHPVVGKLTNGVKLLEDVESEVVKSNSVSISLDDPDYTSAANLAEAVNDAFAGVALAKNASKIEVDIPRSYIEQNRIDKFLRSLEQVRFSPGQTAKVIVNESTGTVVFGGNVKISRVALTHGNITVRVRTSEEVSQPAPLGSGETVVTNQQDTDVSTENRRVQLVPEIVTVQKLVTVLNTLGATPRDIIVIMHSLRRSGALHAKLISE